MADSPDAGKQLVLSALVSTPSFTPQPSKWQTICNNTRLTFSTSIYSTGSGSTAGHVARAPQKCICVILRHKHGHVCAVKLLLLKPRVDPKESIKALRRSGEFFFFAFPRFSFSSYFDYSLLKISVPFSV